MSLRLIFFVCFFWSWAIGDTYGQIIADFAFDDTSDMPASLKKNAAGLDALDINPNARSDGEGVYTLKDPANPDRQQNIDLKIPQDLLSHTESFFMEFDFRSQEDFSWLIYSGYGPNLNLFRFAHVDRPGQRGFHLRYATKKNPGTLIESGYVGGPLQRGERAVIGLMYDKVTGTAYIYKNGDLQWSTADADKTPGYGFHWQTAEGHLTVGFGMDGDGSTTPSLYRFRAFEQRCSALPPVVESEAVCDSGEVVLRASGGDDGQYRWYKEDNGNLTLIQGEINSTYTTNTLSQSATYYVSVAGAFCESSPVPAEAVVHQQPKQPKVSYTPACGPGEVTLYLEEKEENVSYLWYSEEHSQPVEHNDSLSITLRQDTVIYVVARSSNCQSAVLPLYISIQEPPVVDAGEDISILKGESASLFASGDFISCKWSGKEPLENADSPSIEVSPDVTQTYIVTARNSNGCESSDTVTVLVLNKFPVPNAFSPNNDGRNDTWEIPNIEKYPDCKIVIFNRWGNEVFQSTGYRSPWDGTLNGSLLPADTYYYTLRLSPEHTPVKGSVVIFH